MKWNEEDDRQSMAEQWQLSSVVRDDGGEPLAPQRMRVFSRAQRTNPSKANAAFDLAGNRRRREG